MTKFTSHRTSHHLIKNTMYSCIMHHISQSFIFTDFVKSFSIIFLLLLFGDWPFRIRATNVPNTAYIYIYILCEKKMASMIFNCAGAYDAQIQKPADLKTNAGSSPRPSPSFQHNTFPGFVTNNYCYSLLETLAVFPIIEKTITAG